MLKIPLLWYNAYKCFFYIGCVTQYSTNKPLSSTHRKCMCVCVCMCGVCMYVYLFVCVCVIMVIHGCVVEPISGGRGMNQALNNLRLTSSLSPWDLWSETGLRHIKKESVCTIRQKLYTCTLCAISVWPAAVKNPMFRYQGFGCKAYETIQSKYLNQTSFRQIHSQIYLHMQNR